MPSFSPPRPPPPPGHRDESPPSESDDDDNVNGEPWQYHIPGWFLDWNIKSPAELAGLGAICHVDETRDGAVDERDQRDEPLLPNTSTNENTCGTRDDRATNLSEWIQIDDLANRPTLGQWKVLRDDYLNLRDSITCALAVSAIGYPLLEQSVILLHSDNAESLNFLNSLVAFSAKDNFAAFVSCDLGDLQDLGWDFDVQLSERKKSSLTIPKSHRKYRSPEGPYSDLLATLFFDALSARGKNAPTWNGPGPKPDPLTAIIDAAKDKAHGKIHDNQSLHNGNSVAEVPIVFHLQDVNELLDLDDGPAIIRNLRRSMRDRRKTGQRIVLVLSVSGDDPASEPDGSDMRFPIFPWLDPPSPPRVKLLKDLVIRDEDVVRIPSVKRQAARIDGGYSMERIEYAQAIRRALKHAIPVDLAIDPTDLLAPYPRINFALCLPNEGTTSDVTAQRAARQICGRAISNKVLTKNDITAVLERTHVKATEEEKPGPLLGCQTRVEAVREDCSRDEEDLLDCIVDTSRLSPGYDDVIIDEDNKDRIQQLIAISRLSAQTHPLLRQIQMKGALFYGPPGTGKTHLCRAIARESGATMVAINASNLMAKWVGETEGNIAAMFSLCRKLHPCILFLDEADALFYRRGDADQSHRRNHITLFLQEMDGLLADEKTPFVIVATNRPSDLDEAFLRRLPYKAMFNLPTEAERTKILRLWLRDEDLADPVILEQLARKTEGYSGADLKSLCAQAALNWRVDKSKSSGQSESSEDTKLLLTAQHFAKALKHARPAATRTVKKINDDFQQQTLR